MSAAAKKMVWNPIEITIHSLIQLQNECICKAWRRELNIIKNLSYSECEVFETF